MTDKTAARVGLGDEVKDTVSGFTGIAIARHSYLTGCDRWSVQPETDSKGRLPEARTFDEITIAVLIKEKVKPYTAATAATEQKPGGPEKYSDEGRR